MHSLFIDNILGAYLADMQLLSKFNKAICFLRCIIDIFSKYAWVFPLKDEKGITNTVPFQKTLDKSGPKINRIWVDKSYKFYKKSLNSWLQNINIEMHSTHN